MTISWTNIRYIIRKMNCCVEQTRSAHAFAWLGSKVGRLFRTFSIG